MPFLSFVRKIARIGIKVRLRDEDCGSVKQFYDLFKKKIFIFNFFKIWEIYSTPYSVYILAFIILQFCPWPKMGHREQQVFGGKF